VGKKAPFSVRGEQSEFLSQAGYFGEENVFYLCQEWNYDFSVIHPVV
jgi:hypothetical protein